MKYRQPIAMQSPDVRMTKGSMHVHIKIKTGVCVCVCALVSSWDQKSYIAEISKAKDHSLHWRFTQAHT